MFFTAQQIESILPLALSGLGCFCFITMAIIFKNSLLIVEGDSKTDRLLQKRLERLQTGGLGLPVLSFNEKIALYKSRFAQWAEKPAKNFYGSDIKTLEKATRLLAKAGLPDSELDVLALMTQRFMSAISFAALGVGASFIIPFKNPVMLPFCLLLGAVVGGLLPMIALSQKAKKRSSEIVQSLPDMLDLMIVCVEAGLGLDATMQRLAKEAESLAPHLAKEFSRMNREINAGLLRIEVFQSFAQRCDVEELRSLTTLIIQSDKLGSSIAESLRIYSEDMRLRRKQRAEEMAAKASIKMIMPLVFFVFPPLMIILLGPILIQTLKSFGFF